MDVHSALEPLKSDRLRPLVCVAGLAVAAAGTIYLFRRLRGRSDAEPPPDSCEEASPGSNGDDAPDGGAEPSPRRGLELSPSSRPKAAPDCSAELAPYRTAEYARHCPVLRHRARSRQRHRGQSTTPPAASHDRSVTAPWSVPRSAPRNCSPAASLSFSYF